MNAEELRERLKEYPQKMTTGERMKKYMAGEEVDHIPYTLSLVQDVMAEVCGYTSTQMEKDFNIFAEVVERTRDDLGMDGVNVRLTLRSIGAALGSERHIPEHGIDYITKPVLQDYKDLDQMRALDPYSNSILTPLLERARKVKERFPEMALSTGVVGPFSTAVAIRPIESVLKDARKHPELLKELLDISVDHSLQWVEVFTKEFGPATTSVSDPVTCTDILNRKQFETFSKPAMEKLITGLYEITGKKPSLHICGHTKGIWSDIRSMDVSTFSVDNCEDLEEVKVALGDVMAISGNVPPVDIMRNGTVEDVIQETKRCIEKAADSPKGFVLAAGCQVPLGTPEENLLAFVYAARKYGQGAQLGKLPRGLE